MKPGLVAHFEKRHPGGPVIGLQNAVFNSDAGITVLFGASGSGKTTILRCIAGLERLDSGHVYFNNEVWSDTQRKSHLATRSRGIGFVPQNYALFPHLTVAGNIGYGLNSLKNPVRCQRVGEMLEWLDLQELEKRMPAELSGGQQQRVALARALAPRPRLLLLDEPLSALDYPTRLRLRQELRSLLESAAVPAILVTHDRQEACALGDQILVIHEGRMIQQGHVSSVFKKPATADVAELLAIETVIPGVIVTSTNDMATVRVNEVALQASCSHLSSDTKQVIVCIRAEDVSLSLPGEANRCSGENRLIATVISHAFEGPFVRVELNGGFPFSAVMTPQNWERLNLSTGAPTVATIKPSDVHLIPGSS